MQILLSKSLNIFDHLATEEHLLHAFDTEFLFIWRSSPTVVVGKHQNLYAETNFPYIHRNGITLARRISGGGTVYHDEGNINFTFVKNGEDGKLVDFAKQTKPIIHFLNHLDVNASLGKRNNIFINDFKISGNAEHIYKKRILHHGTLLFSSNLQELENTLLTSEEKFNDKAVKSVKANVTNIQKYLHNAMSIENFIKELALSFKQEGLATDFYELNEASRKQIEELKTQKYCTDDWIFGYSPKYSFTSNYELKNEKVAFQLHIEKGKITAIDSSYKELIKTITGMPHRFEHIKKGIKKLYPSLQENALNNIVYTFFY